MPDSTERRDLAVEYRPLDSLAEPAGQTDPFEDYLNRGKDS